ncbi:MAG: orotate phosphoribosyltransferase [Candidatus Altiarchaeales archaeon]|nr:MAG: orotate phosphoribosyltransferase [Candidatus Altiarchaeales archaeon]HDI72637.1 orotate phosphoribosyltransferase [Candidatus Altiarchaeales archaeon]
MDNTHGLKEEERKELLEIIDSRCLKFGKFDLASGGSSNFFFDMKKATLDPKASKLITKAILELLSRENVRYVGGLETGAIPIVSELCVQSSPERPIFGFFVRQKENNRNPKIEGNLERGEKVIIVDDVTTNGGSALNAVKAVRDFGCEVEKVITIVDRLSKAKENLKENNIELISIFTKDDFGRIPKE